MNYQKRIKKLQNRIKKQDLDAFLVLTKINRKYLSDFTGSKGYLLVDQEKGELYVDSRYTIRAKRESTLPVQSLDDVASALDSYSRVGIEDSIRLSEFQRLKDMDLSAELVITSGVIEQIRAVKISKEIEIIKKGSRLIDKAFEYIVEYLQSEIKKAEKDKREYPTEMEIAHALESFAKKNGADGLAFDPIVAFGENAASPHHFSSDTQIKGNNFLLFDFGMKLDGYHTDFTRTVFIGKPKDKHKTIYNIVLKAQQKMIDAVQAGASAGDVDKAGRGYISDKGYDDQYTHNGGHGVGLKIHELPNFASDSQDILKENMVATVEPGIYLEDEFGVRIEDMVIVGDKGAKVLSDIPKDFASMIVK